MQVDYEKLANECKAKRTNLEWKFASKGLLDHFKKDSNSWNQIKQLKQLEQQEKKYRELAEQQKQKNFERTERQKRQENQKNRQKYYNDDRKDKKNEKIPTHQQKEKEINREAKERKNMNSFGQMVATREKINKTTDPQQKKKLETQFAKHQKNWQKEVDVKVQKSQGQNLAKGIGKAAEKIMERGR